MMNKLSSCIVQRLVQRATQRCRQEEELGDSLKVKSALAYLLQGSELLKLVLSCITAILRGGAADEMRTM